MSPEVASRRKSLRMAEVVRPAADGGKRRGSLGLFCAGEGEIAELETGLGCVALFCAVGFVWRSDGVEGRILRRQRGLVGSFGTGAVAGVWVWVAGVVANRYFSCIVSVEHLGKERRSGRAVGAGIGWAGNGNASMVLPLLVLRSWKGDWFCPFRER